MTRRPTSVTVVAVAAVVALVAGCGGSDTRADATPGPADAVAGETPTTAMEPETEPGGDVGSVSDAVDVAAGAPAAAGGVACDVTRRMLETASEVYLTINATPAPNQLALVEAGLIEELSAWFEVTADGAVVSAPASPCP